MAVMADCCAALGLVLCSFEAPSAVVAAVCVMLFPQNTQDNETGRIMLFLNC